MLVELNGGGECQVREFPRERERIDIGDYYADFSRIRDSLGWQPKTSLEEGLALTLDFYRTNLRHYV